MSELVRPEHVSGTTYRLFDVHLILDQKSEFADVAQTLGLIDRVSQGEHRTGRERGLKDLIPFVETAYLPGAPGIWSERRGFFRYVRDEALKEHMDMLSDDATTMNDYLAEHPGIVIATNAVGHAFATVTAAKVEQGKTFRSLAYLMAYSGEVALGSLSSRQVMCDVERLPSSEMRQYIADSVV
jgi:hypothetical protein